MKIAVVFNRESKNVINLFGVPSREKYGKGTIKMIVDALKKGGHQVRSFEGDKSLIDKLEEFMPQAIKGEIPGMVFNVSYGIQGQARYTHVPSILEMVGIPYLGSSPLAHSLALDKVVAKMIFKQNGLSTPDFAVIQNSDFEMPDLRFPLIVKPKNEAVSFGLSIVNNLTELRKAVHYVFVEFKQAVLVEQYIEGREINVGLIGNNPPETMPPVEIIFDEGGPPIYTYEDKTHKSERIISLKCPAEISTETQKAAQELAISAFSSLGCYDCARVDLRLDTNDNLYILEINSLPSLTLSGSYVKAAAHIGLEFTDLVNRLVETASARYFGTPNPSKLRIVKPIDKREAAFSFLTQRRDKIERRLQEWCSISSRTHDLVGIKQSINELSKIFQEIKMKPVERFTDSRSVWMWETKKGFEGGTLFIGHIDTPLAPEMPFQGFRRDPEHLFGEGIGSSRAPLVMLEFALRALRSQKTLESMPLGVLYYADEGFDARYSEGFIRDAAKSAGRVIVLLPGNPGHSAIIQRRGRAKYRLVVEGRPYKLGQTGKIPQPLLWHSEKIRELSTLNSRTKRVAVSLDEVKTESFPMLLPHRIISSVLVSYYDDKSLQATITSIKSILKTNSQGLKWEFEAISNRPPMKGRKINMGLKKEITETANQWDIPFDTISSLWPGVSGLVPSLTPVICGMGPVADQLFTPMESVQRISLIQRTLLFTQYLLKIATK